MSKGERLKKFWADVKAGLRPRPVRQKSGVLRRVTKASLDGTFGPDRDRRIVLTIYPGTDKTPDVIGLRPHGTRREEKVAVVDVYRFAIRCRVNRVVLEKARLRKEKKQAQRIAASIKATERRLFSK